MEDENKLFILFKEFDGLELYKKVIDIINNEIKIAVASQLSKRNLFQVTVMNKVNNVGWDDESTHNNFIDFVRKEGYIIDGDADKFEIEQDEM